MAYITVTNVSPPDSYSYSPVVARQPVRRRLRFHVREGLSISTRVLRWRFGLQPVSFSAINSIAILAAAQTPVQMEFLVGTLPQSGLARHICRISLRGSRSTGLHPDRDRQCQESRKPWRCRWTTLVGFTSHRLQAVQYPIEPTHSSRRGVQAQTAGPLPIQDRNLMTQCDELKLQFCAAAEAAANKTERRNQCEHFATLRTIGKSPDFSLPGISVGTG